MDTGTEKRQAEAKGKPSFVRSVTARIDLLLMLLVVLLAVAMLNAAQTLEQNAAVTLRQTAEIGLHTLEQVLEANAYAVSVLASDDIQLEKLGDESELKRMVASQDLLSRINTLTRSNPNVGNLFLYDPRHGLYLTNNMSGLQNYEHANRIERSVRAMLDAEVRPQRAVWFMLDAEGEKQLCRYYHARGIWVGSVVPLQEWADQLALPEDRTLILTAPDGGEACLFGGADEKRKPDRGDLVTGSPAWTGGRDCLVLQEEWEGFVLLAGLPRGTVYGGFSAVPAVLFVIVGLVIVLAACLFVYIRAQILRPTRVLIDAMDRVRNGETGARVPAEAPNAEFQTIGSSFNEMVDTIVNLRLSSYEDRIQFDEATLKYVQLQIRPHFFLNALTTIHSMTFQDRDEDIRAFIESLSGTIRYLFKAGLHTVPLSEEIGHVRNYIRMQNMLYPGAVFEFIDIEEGAADHQVPQLILHTLVENIYKHAVSVDRLTCILISGRLEEVEGEVFCHLTVEDDGEGFPESFLEDMSRGEVRVREDGHGVGLWNLKKTLELMYRRTDLIAFSNKSPNGSRVDIRVPKRAKRQSSVWQL